MGLFFLLSAYFIEASYSRKGARAFLFDRLYRFGMPVLGFALVFLPLIRHVKLGRPWSECFHPFVWAHLWFLGHLLIYAIAFVIYRQFVRPPVAEVRPLSAARFNGLLLCYALALALVSTLVRLWFPIDRWVDVGVTAEVAHLPQYLSLFVVGVAASHGRWLEQIPPATGRFWLVLAGILVGFRYAYQLYWVDMPELPGLLYGLPWCLWEALLCVAMCVGLLHAFRRHVATTAPLARFLSRHAFAVYVVHLPILVLVQRVLESTHWGPLVLTLVSGALATVLSYALAAVWARLTGMVGLVRGRKRGALRRAAV